MRNPDNKPKTVIEVKDLRITFRLPTGNVRAVRGLDFQLNENEVLALVGESGSGKSVGVKAIMGILPENAMIESGEILFHDKDETIDLLKVKDSFRQKEINGVKIGMVFQDPMTSLNPAMTIGAQMMAVIRSHRKNSKKEAYARSIELLREVGITDPERTMRQYPHQLFRRAAAEDRDRPRPGRKTEADHRGRMHRRAGCLRPGADRKHAAQDQRRDRCLFSFYFT